MTRHVPFMVALAVCALVPLTATANEKEDLERAKEYLTGIEIPLAATVELFDCTRKWRSDQFCKLVWAADIRLWDKKDYVGAIKLAASALALKKRSRRALGVIGSALLRLGDCTAALPYLEASAHLQERAVSVDDYLHCLSDSWSDMSRALRLAELAAHNSGDHWNWYKAAVIHSSLGNNEAARNRADRIIAEHPDDPAAWSSYSSALAAMDEATDALAAATKALELRQKQSKEKARTPVEAYYLGLIGRLMDAGKHVEARQHATALSKAKDEKFRHAAVTLLAWLDFADHGPARALETVAALPDDKAKPLREEFSLNAALMSGDVSSFEVPKDAGLDVRVRWLIAKDDLSAATQAVAAKIREGDYQKHLLSVLDFRNRECGTIASASHSYIRTRADYADLWRGKMFSAAWRLVCGQDPGEGFTPGAKSDELKQFARTMSRAAALFATLDYDDAYRAAAELPAEGPPIFHVFGMWVAAGVADGPAFKRHAEAAARGERRADERLAHVFFHLRRGDVPRAREVWKALPVNLRDAPMLTDVPLAFLAFHVVKAAKEHDADFATQMAEKWFWVRGPLERWIWNTLSATPTQFAEAP